MPSRPRNRCGARKPHYPDGPFPRGALAVRCAISTSSTTLLAYASPCCQPLTLGPATFKTVIRESATKRNTSPTASSAVTPAASRTRCGFLKCRQNSPRERRLTGELTGSEDHRPVALLNVLSRARPIPATGQRRDGVLLGNHPILRLPTRRTPSAARERGRQSRLQRPAIHARLSTGDDFEKRHLSSKLETCQGLTMAHPPSFDDGHPPFDHGFAEELIGKRVLVGVTHQDRRGAVKQHEQFCGTALG
jgi:hypothetical protein